jgi:hypothetical protein
MENSSENNNLDILEQDKSSHGGLRAGAGRPKGSTNKIPRVAKENIIQAFEELGGVDGLVNWAKADQKNQGDFYKIYGRLLPIENNISGADGEDIKMVISWQK